MVAVAQLVEPRIVIPVVAGSSPVGHPIFRDFHFVQDVLVQLFQVQFQIDDNNQFSLRFIWGESKQFHLLFKKALEEGDVIVYNGHAGYNYNINISKVEHKNNFKINFQNRYQILDLPSGGLLIIAR